MIQQPQQIEAAERAHRETTEAAGRQRQAAKPEPAQAAALMAAHAAALGLPRYIRESAAPPNEDARAPGA